jgi:hypothetical protein
LCRCGAYDGIFQAVAQACTGRFDHDTFIFPRLEARDKVTGAAKFTVDIRHAGQLEGAILRSPTAHARILELDLKPALALSRSLFLLVNREARSKTAWRKINDLGNSLSWQIPSKIAYSWQV